jgi:hypothetical protein
MIRPCLPLSVPDKHGIFRLKIKKCILLEVDARGSLLQSPRASKACIGTRADAGPDVADQVRPKTGAHEADVA